MGGVSGVEGDSEDEGVGDEEDEGGDEYMRSVRLKIQNGTAKQIQMMSMTGRDAGTR